MVSAHASTISNDAAACAWSLESMPAERVREVIARTEVTADVAREAYLGLESDLRKLRLWIGVPPNLANELLYHHFQNLTLAMSQVVMGNDVLAQDAVVDLSSKLARQLNVPVDQFALFEDLRRLAVRHEAVTVQGQFALTGAPSPEAVVHHVATSREGRGVPPAEIGPLQIEMIKIALQYGGSRGDVKLLQIGHGFSPLLEAIPFFTGKPLVAVDTLVPSPENAVHFAEYQTELVAGSIPDPSTVLELQGKGPYQVVLAMRSLGVKTFRGGGSPVQVAADIGSLMNAGGTLILVTEFDDAPIFTRAEAQAAGFQVVRWQVPRLIAPDWLSILPEYLRASVTGELSLYVLRKDGLDEARARKDILNIRNGKPEWPE